MNARSGSASGAAARAGITSSGPRILVKAVACRDLLPIAAISLTSVATALRYESAERVTPLRRGLRFTDAPGVGSVHEPNTATTCWSDKESVR